MQNSGRFMTSIRTANTSELIDLLAFLRSPDGIAEMKIRMSPLEGSNAHDNIAEELARRVMQIAAGGQY